MRHIHALTPERVPRDEEFKFRERAKTLVDKWHDILNAGKINGNTSDGPKTTTNGTTVKPVDTADAGGTTNGQKQESEESAFKAVSEEKMDVTAKVEMPASVEVPAGDVAVNGVADGVADGIADGVADTDADADVPMDGIVDESVLADVTMSEFAA